MPNLTRREQFAMHFMAALIQNRENSADVAQRTSERMADAAVDYAKYLEIELDREENNPP